jgi:hypothetical protein
MDSIPAPADNRSNGSDVSAIPAEQPQPPKSLGP